MKVWHPTALSPLPDDHLLKVTTISSFILFLLETFIYMYQHLCVFVFHSITQSFYSFIYSSKKYFLRAYSVPGRILSPGDTVVNKTEKVSPLMALRI